MESKTGIIFDNKIASSDSILGGNTKRNSRSRVHIISCGK